MSSSGSGKEGDQELENYSINTIIEIMNLMKAVYSPICSWKLTTNPTMKSTSHELVQGLSFCGALTWRQKKCIRGSRCIYFNKCCSKSGAIKVKMTCLWTSIFNKSVSYTKKIECKHCHCVYCLFGHYLFSIILILWWQQCQ